MLDYNNYDIFFENIKPIRFNYPYFISEIKRLISSELKETGELTFIYCDDNYLLDINKKFLAHDYYTDIITFDYVKGELISGDLYISIDRIKENAKEMNILFIEEFCRVSFHGVLHLCGYNDKTDEEVKMMREKENYYLEKINYKSLGYDAEV